MSWTVEFHPDFEPEFDLFERDVQTAILARMELIEEFGPQLGRPYTDTLSGSKYANMKELRCEAAGGVWRTAFAFDPDRKAVVLVAGDKSGMAKRRFYKWLIDTADKRFNSHLKTLREKK